ncbi:retinol-binding protein pinta isoform X1 [Halyomorpha halys]|uniref:retinol-binding protein pinta isoform X1 n=2 Tax=Halyomorpha halys TaxID=286706 RepID=UPI0006D519E9|nr:clavesin-1 isoform X1 [Halyomorpha halys]
MDMGMLIDNEKESRKRLFSKLGITEESLKEDVEHLKEWMQKQPHLPAMRHVNVDLWLENQLIMSKNSLEKAKNSIERYCSIRSVCPEWFSGSELINDVFRLTYDVLSLSYLPGLTPRLHKVCIARLEDTDSEKFNFDIIWKRCLMAMEYFLLKGQDFTGFHIIFDFTGLKLSHLARFQVSSLRMMSYSMKAYPVSFTAVNFVNHPNFVDKFVAVLKPFISAKLHSRITCVKDISELKELLGPDVQLPSDYGGEGLSQCEYNEIMKNKLLSIKDYILECDKLRCDDSKRLTKDVTNTTDSGLPGSFRKLCLD